MPPSRVTPPILAQALAALPGAFTDEELFAVLLRDFPEEFSREIGDQGAAVTGDGLTEATDQILAALESPPTSSLVKPTTPGNWKRLEAVAPEDLPAPPDRAALRGAFGRGRV